MEFCITLLFSRALEDWHNAQMGSIQRRVKNTHTHTHTHYESTMARQTKLLS